MPWGEILGMVVTVVGVFGGVVLILFVCGGPTGHPRR